MKQNEASKQVQIQQWMKIEAWEAYANLETAILNPTNDERAIL